MKDYLKKYAYLCAHRISELEETFDIMMDTDDIIDFNSYKKGMEILNKYNITFD